MKIQHIKGFFAGVMILLAVFLIYYLDWVFKRAYRLSFGEPERWQTHWRVEPDAVIEMGTRPLYSGI